MKVCTQKQLNEMCLARLYAQDLDGIDEVCNVKTDREKGDDSATNFQYLSNLV